MARKSISSESGKPHLRLAWIAADSLDENPRNWRTHPQNGRAGIAIVEPLALELCWIAASHVTKNPATERGRRHARRLTSNGQIK
jgi:hypothetical protein